MRISLPRALVLGLFAACLLALGGPPASARSLVPSRGVATARPPDDEAEGKKEGRDFLYKFINLSLLVGALAYLLRKPVAEFFSGRSASIRKGLDEGRKALETSQAQLKTVEEKLRHLEEEIAAFKASAGREMEAEGQRLELAEAQEVEKILQAARTQTEIALRAAKVELKSYAAEQAVQLAEAIIRGRLDEAGQKKLVGEFLADVERKNERPN